MRAFGDAGALGSPAQARNTLKHGRQQTATAHSSCMDKPPGMWGRTESSQADCQSPLCLTLAVCALRGSGEHMNHGRAL